MMWFAKKITLVTKNVLKKQKNEERKPLRGQMMKPFINGMQKELGKTYIVGQK